MFQSTTVLLVLVLTGLTAKELPHISEKLEGNKINFDRELTVKQADSSIKLPDESARDEITGRRPTDGLAVSNGLENPGELPIERHRGVIERHRDVMRRAKRSIDLIMPGTNWCGVGNVSQDNSATGEVSNADRCCRAHDHCPYTIRKFSTKYNLYNYRMYTISHCECDDIFRTCLRMLPNDQGNLIGELFFNYIGMKCFVFRQESVCAERAWWGKCTRQTLQWTAETRDPLEY